ncbi:unnamed protein product [Pseudo-nitzschia multistriata]|uniref:DUF6824 domain-containing protein n=1 Tax=Pseudo-nitzschia multistriata TaxID=183589 RepID=A0A448ZAL2_9STRA|nr:unnamed protein product [Pseudo-nitzschia multistriata]
MCTASTRNTMIVTSTTNNIERKIKTKKTSSKSRIMLPEDFTPGSKDILCGRGNVFSNHAGNQYFGNTIRASLREYMNASNRPEKIRVVDRILQNIRIYGARFAKIDNDTKRWYELNDVQAHQKIGHAIRDTIRLIQKGQGKKNIRPFSVSGVVSNETRRKQREQTRTNTKRTTNKKAVFFPLPSASNKIDSHYRLRTASETRNDAMEDILRLSLDTVDFLDESLGTEIHRDLPASITPPQSPSITKKIASVTSTLAPTKSYLLHNEYPEESFNFSASTFFGENTFEHYPRSTRITQYSEFI